MTCQQLVELLLDFVDGSLPESERCDLERHVCACPPCRVYLDTYKQTIRLTRELPCEPLPEALEERLRAVLSLRPKCRKPGA